MNEPTKPRSVAGLTGVIAKSPERVHVRSRSSNVTRAAWRIEVASDQGPGTIVLIEISPGEQYYRGDGAFLGWNQEQLAATYQELVPKTDSEPELPQLG